MTRATYRCACGWSARRLARVPHIQCEECRRAAYPVDPTPGRPAAPPELARVDFRVRPIGISVQVLGADEARRIGAAAIDEAAKRKHETLVAETTHFRVIRPKPLPDDPPHDPDKIHSYTTTWPELVTSGRPRRRGDAKTRRA